MKMYCAMCGRIGALFNKTVHGSAQELMSDKRVYPAENDNFSFVHQHVTDSLV